MHLSADQGCRYDLLLHRPLIPSLRGYCLQPIRVINFPIAPVWRSSFEPLYITEHLKRNVTREPVLSPIRRWEKILELREQIRGILEQYLYLRVNLGLKKIFRQSERHKKKLSYIVLVMFFPISLQDLQKLFIRFRIIFEPHFDLIDVLDCVMKIFGTTTRWSLLAF